MKTPDLSRAGLSGVRSSRPARPAGHERGAHPEPTNANRDRYYTARRNALGAVDLALTTTASDTQCTRSAWSGYRALRVGQTQIGSNQMAARRPLRSGGSAHARIENEKPVNHRHGW
jgi:hypothetical protein